MVGNFAILMKNCEVSTFKTEKLSEQVGEYQYHRKNGRDFPLSSFLSILDLIILFPAQPSLQIAPLAHSLLQFLLLYYALHMKNAGVELLLGSMTLFRHLDLSLI